MLGRSLSEIRYLVEFVPVEAGGPDKAGSWIEEGLSVDDIHRRCRAEKLRAYVFDLGDVARMRRLVIVPPAGVDSGKVYQLTWAEQQRALEARKPTGWDAVLGDDFG